MERRPRAAGYWFERRAWHSQQWRVAGVDEAGRGPLAGPVVAAAVVLHPDRRIPGLSDSKLLLPAERAAISEWIFERAHGVGVGVVGPETVDRVNILEATRFAMVEALGKLSFLPELVLTDAVHLASLACPQKNLIKGDRRSASVAAASIVAKVTRDRLMTEADCAFPQYGFRHHKGYATPEHLAALDLYGPCPLHRRTFHGVCRQGELFPR